MKTPARHARNLALTTLLAGTLAGPSAHAVGFSLSGLSGMNSAAVESLLKTAAIGGDHRPYMSAAPLGVALGFDLGLDVTVIIPPADFATAFASATGQAVPSVIPLPRLNIHKGLPGGIDLGFSFLTYSDPSYAIRMYGAEVKWAFVRGGLAMPSVAARLSGSYNTLGFLNTHTYKLDVVGSKSFSVIEPYVGTGLQNWAGDLKYDTTVYSLPVGVAGSASGTNAHFYGGLVLKMVAVRITAEADYSTAGVTTYGGKFSFGF